MAFAPLALAVFLLAAHIGGAQAAPSTEGMHYAGTVGQQRITLQLDVSEDNVRGGTLRYGSSATTGGIRIVDSRRFGTTLVLQDEDGDILHLHFETAAGQGTGSLAAADMLEGTLDRGELDLPVKLERKKQ